MTRRNHTLFFTVLVISTFAYGQPCGYDNLEAESYNFGTGKEIYSTPSPPIFNWQMVQTPVTYFINDIHFVDSLYGWASHNNGGLLKTTNGGFNWTHEFFIPGGCLCGVYFLNRDTGWVVGSMGLIRKTTSGGMNWTKQDHLYGSLPYFYSVKFMNYMTGYVTGKYGTKGYIIKTTNSGLNWQQIYIADSSNSDFFGQFWVNNNTGYFHGSNVFIRTTNAGNTFTDYYPNIPPTSNGYNAILGLYFVNEQTGWISGSNVDHKNLYKTTNSGLSWIFQNNPVTAYQFAQLDDIIFINESTGWAAAYAAQIIVTTNGGANWLTDLSAPNWFYCFEKFNSTIIWCGAHHGEIWILNDSTLSGLTKNGQNVPGDFLLKQNYPNPFNNQTVFEFNISKKSKINLRIVDSQGKEIAILVNEVLNQGEYRINYDGANLSSGVYFYILESEFYRRTRKFVLLK